jgi:hypothetical protein
VDHEFLKMYKSGGAACADTEDADAFPAELNRIVEEGGYRSKQVFNADESGLHWKSMPSRK